MPLTYRWKVEKNRIIMEEKQITNSMNQKNTYKPTERLFTL